MIRRQFVIALLFAAFAATFAHASVTIGPFQDFRERLEPAAAAQSRVTSAGSHKGYNITDSARFDVPIGSSAVDLRGAMYVTADDADFTGDFRITTIYGLDANPGEAALLISGFNPAAPEVASIFDETITGNTQDYHADFAATPTLSELALLLPGFDLSPFQGSSSSFFYVFQTTAPSSDLLAVPEPSAWVLATTGLTVIFWGAQSQRRLARRGACENTLTPRKSDS
jgi:hypothetical protein